MEWPRISARRREFLQDASLRYEAALDENEEARAYLRSRGFDDGVCRQFRLGFVADPAEGHEAMRGYLSIPYRSYAGLTAIRFRRVGDGEEGKRWLAETGYKDPLYNVLDLHRPEPYIAICEGQTDTITMSGLVGVPAVGTSGAGKWEDFWDYLFVDYEQVLVLRDPDPAGDNSARKLLDRLGHNARQVRLPADVNSTFLQFRSDYIREKLGV